ncbi:AAA family ATPase [bacterium]|nr:AAA family ATPase [bacterium]
MNKEYLNKLARDIQETKQNKYITLRELLKAFGVKRRTSGRCDEIDRWLDSNNLLTYPYYKDCYIDQHTSLCYKSNNFQLYFLKIKGYKNLVDFFVDLKFTHNYCCFIGLNGSGKSNVLEAISLIFYSLYHIATLKNGLKKYSCEFQYTIRYILKGKLYEISDGILKDGNKITPDILPQNIIASYSGEDTRLWEECYKPFYKKYRSNIVKQGFEPPFMFYLSRDEWEISLLTLLYSEDIDVIKFINDLIGTSACKISFDYNTSNIQKWVGSDVEGFINKLREKSDYDIESFRKTINDISFIDKASTLFYCLYKCRTDGDKQIIKKINIEFDNRGSLEGLSEGEKKLINANVVIHILSTENSLCLFDEPDAHIHIGKQRELKELIDTDKRYSLVTTHSPVFLDMLYNDNNIRYMDNGSAHNTDRLREISLLSDGAINYLEGSFILSSKKILVVEGKYDEGYLKKAINIFAKSDKKYYKLKDIAIISANSAGAAKLIYKQIFSQCIDKIEKIVFLFDYDDDGWKSGWKQIKKLHDKNSKIIPLFYQDDYSSSAYPTLDEDVRTANNNELKILQEHSFLVEDLFSEKSYQKVIKPVISARKHKDFRQLTMGKNGTAGTIKHYIEDNYEKKDFRDKWFDGFKPVLDKLLEVFDLG